MKEEKILNRTGEFVAKELNEHPSKADVTDVSKLFKNDGYELAGFLINLKSEAVLAKVLPQLVAHCRWADIDAGAWPEIIKAHPGLIGIAPVTSLEFWDAVTENGVNCELIQHCEIDVLLIHFHRLVEDFCKSEDHGQTMLADAISIGFSFFAKAEFYIREHVSESVWEKYCKSALDFLLAYKGSVLCRYPLPEGFPEDYLAQVVKVHPELAR